MNRIHLSAGKREGNVAPRNGFPGNAGSGKLGSHIFHVRLEGIDAQGCDTLYRAAPLNPARIVSGKLTRKSFEKKRGKRWRGDDGVLRTSMRTDCAFCCRSIQFTQCALLSNAMAM